MISLYFLLILLGDKWMEALEMPYWLLDIAILVMFATHFIQVILVQCMGSSGVTLVLNMLICTLTTAGRGWISWHRSYTPSRQTLTIGGSSCLPGTQSVRGRHMYLLLFVGKFCQALSVTKIFTIMAQRLSITTERIFHHVTNIEVKLAKKFPP